MKRSGQRRRDGTLVAPSKPSPYTDGPLGKGGGSATYQVCETGGTASCSNQATVSW